MSYKNLFNTKTVLEDKIVKKKILCQFAETQFHFKIRSEGPLLQ